MRSNGATELAPTRYEIMTYLIQLSDEVKPLPSVRNYCSGARMFVLTFSRSVPGFNTYPLTLVRMWIENNGLLPKTWPIGSAAPPRRNQLAEIRFFMPINKNGLTLVATLLIGYLTLLRHSYRLEFLPLLWEHRSYQSHTTGVTRTYVHRKRWRVYHACPSNTSSNLMTS